MLSPLNLPDNIILLITDELPSPGDFLLHRALSTHLKLIQRHRKRAVILSVSEDLGRWKALASKTNINLQNHLDSGSVLFMDLSTAYQDGMLAVFDRLKEHLSDSEEMLLILDDVTSLEWIGVPLSEIQRFIRALRSLCLKTKTTLIIRHHLVATSNTEPDDIFRLLLQICDYHVEVRPLASGRSGEVTGEISLHQGFSVVSEVKPINKSSAIQFKLTDGGPDFFAKGTSSGVL